MRTADLILLRNQASEAVERLIALIDAIDGDCEDEGAQCDDEGHDDDREGHSDDNGLADTGGAVEQLTIRPQLVGHRTGNYEDRPW
jgi:hypothetical protein